jgi:hypothetical protein
MQNISYFDKNLNFLALGDGMPSIPREHSFLKKYFKTKIQNTFLHYYYFVGCKDNFSDHTGCKCDKSFVHKMIGKFEWLLHTFDSAKKNFDLETLGKLQMKKIKLLKKFC